MTRHTMHVIDVVLHAIEIVIMLVAAVYIDRLRSRLAPRWLFPTAAAISIACFTLGIIRVSKPDGWAWSFGALAAMFAVLCYVVIQHRRIRD